MHRLPHTQRGIKSRHAQMLAIGGTIGTGLFVGVGSALSIAGPAFLLLSYALICLLVYAVITATTEMNTYLPVHGCSMAAYATRFVSPSLGLSLGLLYWYSFGILVAYETTAAALVINYWSNPVPLAVWITLMLLVVFALNFSPVRIYGETEFWFASLKVFLILGLLILSFILFWGGGPSHTRLGFHYWNHPGATNTYLVSGATGRFCAFVYTLCYSVFSFTFGPELLVVAAGEMQNPRTNLPRAARQFFYRLLVFYVLGVLAIGVICPSNASGLTTGTGVNASPWVIAIKHAGISGLDSVVNAVIITSAWSAANSYLYMSSRTLYSLAAAGAAPPLFKRCTRHGVPYYAVLASASFGALAYMDCSAGASTVFTWFVSLTNSAGMISWTACAVVYLRFRRACAVQRVAVPYRSCWQPYGAWAAMVVCPAILLGQGFQYFVAGNWSVSGFLTSYIGAFVFLGVYAVRWGLGAWRWGEGWWLSVHEVDLRSGLEEVEALELVVECEGEDGGGRKGRWWERVWG
ncbi:hypothetical protein BO86DRAFT_317778 [Aspergillus japonicus CBS 114.51]|uniref:Amino acid permease/ SLC12A domain-containing protein n=1 Tax=Aspergillus japonicus CBS 114.51 TaxID=1448312 RepID=A0A8T8WV79_ASPJA|nr:hypothetical protein BO86DRAFT_317778 [Aspergillus japonicus CBS 114.51]RAH79731.1 hypothetical protein BO86DRAFT_317778 [Aspergillus japonicus CBS 114.51]